MCIKKENICGVILTGGLSSRMGGGIKSLKKFNNKTIFDRVLKKISKQVQNVIINSNNNDIRFKKYNLTVIKDKLEGHLGPLAGIHASLYWIKYNIPETKWLVSVPSDTPFLPNDLVEKLYLKANKNNKKIILAKSYNKIHPVIGIWKCDILKDLEKSILNGTRKIMLWVKRHPMDTVEFNKKIFDPFFNINFKEDLIKAKEIEDYNLV